MILLGLWKVLKTAFLKTLLTLTAGYTCLQFAVAIEARANTSIDKMELINAVAKIVPQPHSVDLRNPQKTILLQIVKVRNIFHLIFTWFIFL